MSRKRLTDPRSQILAAIRDSVKERGYPPTLREIAEAVGLASTSSVHYHLRALRRDGLIELVPGRPRSVVIHLPKSALLKEITAALEALRKGYVATARQILTDLAADLGDDPINDEAAPDAPGAASDPHERNHTS